MAGSQARKKSSASREAGVSVYTMSEKSQNLTLESHFQGSGEMGTLMYIL